MNISFRADVVLSQLCSTIFFFKQMFVGNSILSVNFQHFYLKSQILKLPLLFQDLIFNIIAKLQLAKIKNGWEKTHF